MAAQAVSDRAGAIAKLADLLAHKRQPVAFLTGAGMSVAAGIPDFRSPGGMYDTLRPELLTATAAERRAMASDPTAVVSWELFQRNPLPYLELRRPFMIRVLGDRAADAQAYAPTLAHFFMRLCHDKGLLRRVYTQNIDGLDYKTGIPADKMIAVHGSLGRVECERCGAPYPSADFVAALKTNIKDIYGLDPDAPAESSGNGIPCGACGAAAVKPATVLYGRALPREFFRHKDTDLADLPLLIIAGTSLTVFPAASVATDAPAQTAKAVFDKVPRGSGGEALFVQGDCDESFLDLCRECGWVEDLRQYRPLMAAQSRALLDRA